MAINNLTEGYITLPHINLTEEHISYFRERVFHYLDKFNIENYEGGVLVSANDEENPDTRAQAFMSQEGGQAQIVLYTKNFFLWEGDVFACLDSVARHEMIHLITAELYNVALSRHASANSIYDASEKLVRKLTKLLENYK